MNKLIAVKLCSKLTAWHGPVDEQKVDTFVAPTTSNVTISSYGPESFSPHPNPPFYFLNKKQSFFVINVSVAVFFYSVRSTLFFLRPCAPPADLPIQTVPQMEISMISQIPTDNDSTNFNRNSTSRRWVEERTVLLQSL